MGSDETAVLVVTGIGGWIDGTPQTEKIETHIYPLADAVDQVDLVSPGPTTERDDIQFYQISKSRWQLVTLFKQFLLAIWLATMREYTLVVSFALVPYGMFALICGRISRTPSHLGIIGMDLDVHAEQWYGPAIRWLFRRFDLISVAGDVFRQRLLEYGVDPSNVFILYHPVSEEYFAASQTADPEYDLLWLTRLSPEKDPLFFVEILEELQDRSLPVRTAFVGDGPLRSEVETALDRRNLTGEVDLPGWINEPLEYYRNAAVYVMTSRREMLPLSLVEAMYVGVPPVVPSLGAIPDLVDHGESGFVIENRSADAFADRIEALLRDETLRNRLGENAPAIHAEVSESAVADTWREVLATLPEAFEGQRRESEPSAKSTAATESTAENSVARGDQ